MTQPNDGRLAPDSGETNEFEAVKARLEEIAQAVDDDALSLDAALDLYEEAVTLGLRASDLLEIDVEDDLAIQDVSQGSETQPTQLAQSAPDGSAPADEGQADTARSQGEGNSSESA